MSKYNISGIGDVTVVHKMVDGSVLDSVIGYQVNLESLEPAALQILRKWISTSPCNTAEIGLN